MKTKLIVTLFAVALVVAATAAVAQRGRGGPGMGMGRAGGGPCGLGLGLGPNMVTELGLTDAQITRLQSITDRFLADTQSLRVQMQTKTKELAQLWTAPNPNKPAIRAKVAEIDKIRTRIRDAMIDHTFSVMNVLTPAQRTKLREFVANRPGFGSGMGMCLGLGCFPGGGNCYMGRGPQGPGGNVR